MNEISRKIRAVLARRQRLSASRQPASAKKILLYVVFGFVGLFLAGIIAFTIFIAILSIGLPDVHDIDKLSVAQSTTIYDREGNVLYVKHGDENRQYVPYSEISPHLVNATVAIEDGEFWSHKGFDLPGIIKAGMYEVFGVGTPRGGSTITQQYVKNAFLSAEHSYTRKIKELILAVRLEQAYDKQTILELYLNKIPYGNTAYGVQKAAEIYFGKDAKDLDPAESAILASLPKAPSYYNPYGSNRYVELITPMEELEKRGICNADQLERNIDYKMGLIGKGIQISDDCGFYVKGRADLILKQMFDDGYITEEEKDKAWEEMQSIEFNEHIARMKAPHFVFYVLDQLEEKYGKDVVEQGGLQVYTTLDPQLQEIAEQAVTDGVAANARFNATNASLVSINHKTGEIVAMVGSKDYYDESIDGNVNIATSYRQPGSSFKPYVYAMAFYNRYSPATILYDVRTKFGSKYPDNYEGGFRGPMTIRTALAQSRNIPALKAYYLAGEQEPIMDLAERMGINFLTRDRDYGWSLALGSAEIRLIDHTSAFGVFANGGKRMEPVAILKVTNAQGDVLEEVDLNKGGEEVLDPQVAYLITSILSDANVRLGPTMSVTGQVNAAKTGTSNKKVGNINIPSNLLTVGYTTYLTTGVWAGNSDDSKSGNLAASANGYEAAAPIFKQYMTQAHNLKGYQYADFPVPPGIQTRSISSDEEITPDQAKSSEIFASFSEMVSANKNITTAKIDTRNGLLANEYCPPSVVEEKTFQEHHCIDPAAYPEWEIGVQLWARGMAEKEGGVIGAAPTETSPLCTKEHFNSSRSIKITDPSNYSKVEPGSLPVSVNVRSDFDVDNVTFYFDGTLQNVVRESPYTGTIRLSQFLKPGSVHTIRALITDVHGYTAESSIEIKLQGEPEEEPSAPVLPEGDVIIDTETPAADTQSADAPTL